MNKVRAVLLPAWCTSKEAEGGSGPWVTVSIWPWPPGLGRWFNVETAPRHPPALPMFRFCVDKVRTAITWEGIFFLFSVSMPLKEEGKRNQITKWWLLTLKSVPNLWLEMIEVRRLSWQQCVIIPLQLVPPHKWILYVTFLIVTERHFGPWVAQKTLSSASFQA